VSRGDTARPRAERPGPRLRTARPLRLALLLVAIVAVAAFATSLGNGFAYDDDVIIVDNPRVTAPASIGTIFTSPYWGSRERGGLYRPVATLSYAWNHRLHGLEPFGYHLVNVLLHAAVSVLLVLVALEVLPLAAATLAGLLFAAHPIHVEAVANVVGRAELLAALGVLVAWLAARRATGGERLASGQATAAAHSAGARTTAAAHSAAAAAHPAGAARAAGAAPTTAAAPSAAARTPAAAHPAASRTTAGSSAWLWRALAAVAYLFGLFSKEVAVLLPGALLAWDLLRRRRPDAALYSLFGVALAIYFYFRFQALGAFGNPAELVLYRLDNVLVSLNPLQALWTAVGVFGRYAVLLVFPWRLSADYSYPQIEGAGPGDPWAWLGLLALAALGTLFVRSALHVWRASTPPATPAPRAPVIVLALLIFGAFFLPVSNFVLHIGTVMAERLLYLPSVGACVLLALAGWRAWTASPTSGPVRPVLLTVLGLVLVAGSARCLTRSLDWKDSATLHASTLRTSPRSARAQFNQGPTLFEAGRREEAVAHVRRATELDPTYTEAWINLGGYLLHMERFDEARRAFEGALAAEPDDEHAHLAMGALEHREGNFRKAVDHFEIALREDPGLAEAWYDLGLAQQDLGDTTAAIAAFRNAVALAPTDPDARNNLAWLLVLTGPSAAEALTEARTAVQLRADAASWDTLAEAAWRAGETNEAVTAWRRALELGAPNADAIRRRLTELGDTP
jgi:tetratricopeptide (TPR) repeat protein